MSLSSNSILIKGVRLYGEGDPVDVLVTDGQIAEIGTGLVADLDLVEVIDADGQVLLPGFVDLHTHLREPGREYTETIETGSAAAALGGFTAVFAMANTDPVADSPVVTDHVWKRGRDVGLVDVHPVGAVTTVIALPWQSAADVHCTQAPALHTRRSAGQRRGRWQRRPGRRRRPRGWCR